MKRALHIAGFGYGSVSPNPMVGSVIAAPDGRIIGEGWHRKHGGPHAEVNAVNSIKPKDLGLIPESTIYVTLEPCSHYGKTPPCCKLLIEKGFKHVVVGCTDPFKDVRGRGIDMMREAGIEVTVPFMERECRAINRKFMTAHSLSRPYIMLKWAQSEDGFIGIKGKHVKLSTPLSTVEMHRERAGYDAILTGTDTIINDNPSLTNREWSGNSPRPVVFSSKRIPQSSILLGRNPVILDTTVPLDENIRRLYSEHNITSLMVEGGAKTLDSFISVGLFDEIRIETVPIHITDGIPAPSVPPQCTEMTSTHINGNLIVDRIYQSPVSKKL